MQIDLKKSNHKGIMASGPRTVEMNLTGSNGSQEFSCSMSDLSTSEVVDHSFWILNQDLIFGIPLVAVLKLLVFLLTFITYMFLTVTVIAKRQLRQQKHHPLTINLGIAGVLNSVTILLFGVAFEISPGAEFVYGGSDAVRCGVCSFAGFLFVLFNTILLHTLAANSIVRFVLLVVVFTKMSKHHLRATVVLIWFISFWIAILPVAGFGLYEFDNDFGACIPRLTGISKSGVENRAYVGFLLLEALIPLCVTIFANLVSCRSTLRHVSRTRKKRNETDLKQVQKFVEIFTAFSVASILWIPIIIIAFIIITTSPETLSREIYVTCWLLYLCNPMLMIAEVMRILKLDF